ncbi:S-adenosyl-L-methionine-dependent methyltransferase [Massarina eburnea CBS 473.64]|uniref:S-adenosyl-L-methionine-dependent methyltransferase n=1 Tax=Massarina eburnea CBS 473.64 TaxID=1395130 RepID=A0A6A6RX74_9PLEO|nr:S-adenosyl-L-methionine-dependent methyltransferase [Massarina eburnea CBS 473.64]
MASEVQADNAKRFYESRSHTFDDTWHPDFTKRFISHLSIQPGQHVLDLACGTGLLTFLEADVVGSNGKVVGVDVTPGMLAMATYKKQQAGDRYSNVSLHQGDVLHLDAIEDLKGSTFDVITLASAFVLFPDPKAAVEHWSQFLKPGGVLALDATHPRNLVSGMVLERTARRLELSVPYNRSWSQSESTLKEVVESAGLRVESVVTVHDQAGYGKRLHDVGSWDDHFVENVIVKDVTRTFATNEIRKKAQEIFKEEWERLAVDGKVEEVDAVFLAIARKPADGSRYISASSGKEVVFNGGCRCGGVQYTCTAQPSDITFCHCRACQQTAGTAFLAFFMVPTDSISFTSTITLKQLSLSKFAHRWFCTGCGSPIKMAYHFESTQTGLLMAGVDLETFKGTMPKIKQHIFLKEKAPWFVLPDDGAARLQTSPFDEQLGLKQRVLKLIIGENKA